MQNDIARAGHSYFGVVSSAQEAHAILEACKLGLLPRVTRRLTDEERTRFIRSGAVFVWEEEEAGIRRWTDHIKWSPSRVSGAFLTYTEVPTGAESAAAATAQRGEESLIKQSFSATDSGGSKMHLIAYTSKSAFASGTLPLASRDPLIRQLLSQRARTGPDTPGDRIARPPATAPPSRGPLHRSESEVPMGAFPRRPSTTEYPRSASTSRSTPSLSTTAATSGAGSNIARSISFESPAMNMLPSHARPAIGGSEMSFHPPPSERVPSAASNSLRISTLTSSTSSAAHPLRYDPVRDGPASAPPTCFEFPPFASRREGARSPPRVHSLSTFYVPRASVSTDTRASPFDATPRQLPPLRPSPTTDETARGESDRPYYEGAPDRSDPLRHSRAEARGAEDERQLRLLGRSF
ncbi:Gluconate transport-inducing protein [Rhodotorula sphaerocarpa]